MTGRRLARLLARALLGLGFLVGAVAMGLWVFDVQIEIPHWMWRVAMVKLTLAGAIGMFITGASALRYLRRAELRDLEKPLPDEQLPAPNWSAAVHRGESVPLERTRSGARTP